MSHFQLTNDARLALAETILQSKEQKGLSFQDLAKQTQLSLTFVTAALLGQHPLPKDAAEAVGKKLGLREEEIKLLQAVPMRGSTSGGTPSDPTIYRFYAMMSTYGTALKALVNELFGDGVISAINFRMDIKKVEDPEGGSRAVITLDGKFLPVKPY